jgi:acetyltransferase-like isoleucine patch superfamily enzyme
MTLRRLALYPARGVAATAAAVLLVTHRAGLIGFLTAARLIAMIPGDPGILVRRAWYRRTLAACGADVVVEWMAVLKTPAIRVGRRVHIGSFCFIAEADLRDDVMIAQGVIVQGGAHTHGFARTDIPMVSQPGELRTVVIGPDVWIGAGARILTDVPQGTVVGAGAVVTRPGEPFAILAGVPARTIRARGGQP